MAIRADKIVLRSAASGSATYTSIIAESTDVTVDLSAESLDAASQSSGLNATYLTGKNTGSVAGNYLLASDANNFSELFIYMNSGNLVDVEIYRDGTQFIFSKGVLTGLGLSGGVSDSLSTGSYTIQLTNIFKWHLPSKDELNEMYDELHDQVTPLGDFEEATYMSSSESAATTEWTQLFSNGNQANNLKSSSYRARPVRTFTAGTGVYSVRDTGPGGGLIFYASGTTYMEAYPSDLSSAPFSNITDVSIGTTGTAIGTGLANTIDIINQTGHTASAALSSYKL